LQRISSSPTPYLSRVVSSSSNSVASADLFAAVSTGRGAAGRDNHVHKRQRHVARAVSTKKTLQSSHSNTSKGVQRAWMLVRPPSGVSNT
jgi:hypothetical protein